MRWSDMPTKEEAAAQAKAREEAIVQLAKNLEIEDKPKLAAYLYSLQQSHARLSQDMAPYQVID